MVASSSKESETRAFSQDEVGSSNYLNRHSTQMFTEGKSFSGNERDKLFLNRGDGTFVDISDVSGCDSPNDGRAVLANDFDDDGDVDLFVHQLQRERHSLYRNDEGDGKPFIKVRLEATTGQWEGVGAQITARGAAGSVSQVASRGAGFVSCMAPEWIFGPGEEASLELEVLWPGGARESFGSVEAGARVILEEGTGKPRAFPPHTVAFADPGPVGLRIAVGEVLDEFRALDRNGEERKLQAEGLAANGELYVNFWASWCQSCVAELPALSRMNEEDGVRVIGISVDTESDRQRALELFDGRSSHETYFITDAGEAGGLGKAIDFDRLPIPTTLVIGKGGRLLRVITGPIE